MPNFINSVVSRSLQCGPITKHALNRHCLRGCLARHASHPDIIPNRIRELKIVCTCHVQLDSPPSGTTRSSSSSLIKES
jgi:hypothetical protein